MKQIYKLTYCSGDKGYAWAGGYGPIDDLWFLMPISLERKQAFWRANPMEPGIYIDKGGKKWPDILGCGHSPPGFFVSERILNSLAELGVSLRRVSEIPIVRIEAKSLIDTPRPRYFVVATQPGIEVDFDSSGIQVDGEKQSMANLDLRARD